MSVKDVIGNPRVSAETTPKAPCRVDVWAALAGASGTTLHGSELLDNADWQWCERLRQAEARRQFITAHILLRAALSEAVHGSVRPDGWRFERDDKGKLSLAPGLPKLHFSLSDEHRVAIAAVCATNPVGVDVVLLAEPPLEPPIWSAAAPSERVLLLSESPGCEAHDFARLWSLKEAYTKMLGIGHGLDFSSLEGDLARRQLRQAERDCKVAFETHTLWTRDDDHYFVALAVGTEVATRIDSRGHLLDLTGESWFRRSEVSPGEGVWPKRWKWHWL